MKDDNIKSKVIRLKAIVKDLNELMAELDTLNVDVKISYIESSKSKDIKQGVSVWRIEECNSYLNDE